MTVKLRARLYARRAHARKIRTRTLTGSLSIYANKWQLQMPEKEGQNQFHLIENIEFYCNN